VGDVAVKSAWLRLQLDVDNYLNKQHQGNELLLHGRFSKDGNEVGHYTAFIRLELGMLKQPVILHLDSNKDWIECSNSRLFKKHHPGVLVSEIAWSQFEDYQLMFTYELKSYQHANARTQLRKLKDILDKDDPEILKEDAYLPEEEDLTMQQELSARMSQLGSQGRETSQRSRNKSKLTGRKRPQPSKDRSANYNHS